MLEDLNRMMCQARIDVGSDGRMMLHLPTSAAHSNTANIHNTNLMVEAVYGHFLEQMGIKHQAFEGHGRMVMTENFRGDNYYIRIPLDDVGSKSPDDIMAMIKGGLNSLGIGTNYPDRSSISNIDSKATLTYYTNAGNIQGAGIGTPNPQSGAHCSMS